MKRERNPYSIHYIRNQINEIDPYTKWDINPEFQRHVSWNLKRKKNLIQVILEDKFMPEIIIGKHDKNWIILDGKQRISSIIEFLDNKFKIDEKYFSDLSKDDQSKFLSYKIGVSEVQGTKSELIDLFLAINTSNLPLTSGQIRKAETVFNGSNIYQKIEQFINKKNTFNLVFDKITLKKLKQKEQLNDFVLSVIAVYNYNELDSGYHSVNDRLNEFLNNINNFDLNNLDKILNDFDFRFKKIIDLFELKKITIKNTPLFKSWLGLLCSNNFNQFEFKDNLDQFFNIYIEYLKEYENKEIPKNGNYQKTLYKRIFNSLNQVLPKKDKKRNFSKEVKKEVLEKQKFKCKKCKIKLPLESLSAADHIVPFSKGGKTDINNLQILCNNCNLEKSNN